MPQPSPAADTLPTGGDPQPKKHEASLQPQPAPSAPLKKHAQQQEEGSVAVDEEERRAKRRAGGGGRYNTARGPVTGKSYGTTARYASSKGKASARFQAMTARDAEREARDRAREMSRRESARKTARRAALNRTPLPTTQPVQPAWRKYPMGQSAAAGDPGQQLDDVWDQVEQEYAMTRFGLPPQPQEQTKQTFGSQRPLSSKERAYQIEKMEENAARRRLHQLKEQEKERLAIAKHEARQKELERYRKAQQRPKNELKENQARAKAVRDRLGAVQERERAWRDRVAA